MGPVMLMHGIRPHVPRAVFKQQVIKILHFYNNDDKTTLDTRKFAIFTIDRARGTSGTSTKSPC